MSERFTAVIKIVKVSEESSGSGTQRVVKDKDVELLSVTIRKDSLPALLTAAKAHIDLVEDYQP